MITYKTARQILEAHKQINAGKQFLAMIEKGLPFGTLFKISVSGLGTELSGIPPGVMVPIITEIVCENEKRLIRLNECASREAHSSKDE